MQRSRFCAGLPFDERLAMKRCLLGFFPFWQPNQGSNAVSKRIQMVSHDTPLGCGEGVRYTSIPVLGGRSNGSRAARAVSLGAAVVARRVFEGLARVRETDRASRTLTDRCYTIMLWQSRVSSSSSEEEDRGKLVSRCGVVWCGVVWCGVVWCGVVWCGVVWCGVVWCGVVWCGVVWCGVVWCGVVWCVFFERIEMPCPVEPCRARRACQLSCGGVRCSPRCSKSIPARSEKA